MSHKLLYAVSVLPALLIMPAVAENYDSLLASGKTVSYDDTLINIVANAEYAAKAENVTDEDNNLSLGKLILGGENTNSITVKPKAGQSLGYGIYGQGADVTLNAKGSININVGKTAFGVAADNAVLELNGAKNLLIAGKRAIDVVNQSKVTVNVQDGGTLNLSGSYYAIRSVLGDDLTDVNAKSKTVINAGQGSTMNLKANGAAVWATGDDVTITGDTINIGNVSAPEKDSAQFGLRATSNAMTGENKTKENEGSGLGAHITVTGKQVEIVNNSVDCGAIYAQNYTTNRKNEDELSKITVNSDTIKINAKNAIVAISQGVVELNGNTTINAPNRAITVRGNAQVTINKSGDYFTKMYGDINFNYHEATSKTSIDALVDVVFAGAESEWIGNTVVRYDKIPGDRTKLIVSNATITLKDGATWNATKIKDIPTDTNGLYYTALNNLNIVGGGTVAIDDTTRGIEIDNANIDGGKFSGGHVQINKTATIANSTFSGVGASEDDEDVAYTDNGGAIYNAFKIVHNPETDTDETIYADTEISNSSFSGNVAARDGGAIYNVAGTTLTVNQGTVFDGNHAYVTDDIKGWDEKGEYGFGGALYSKGAFDLDNVTFKNNYATDGGAVYMTGNVDRTIKNSLFEGNHAAYDGAVGIGTKGKSLNITNTVFKDNEALSTGALGVFAGPATLTGVDFIGNKATASDNDGAGALFAGASSQTTVNGGTFVKNQSASFGGAIATRKALNAEGGKNNNSGAKLDIIGAEFTGNVAATNGGAIYNSFYNDSDDSGFVTIAKSTFSGNTAKDGGAIYNDGTPDRDVKKGGAMNLSNVTFENNVASENGGAIYNTKDALITMSGTNVFSGNRFGSLANDIYNDGSVVMSGGETTFGGGVRGNGTFDMQGGTLNLGTGTIQQNTITLNGKVNANVVDERNYGRLVGNIDANGATLNLTVATAGTYKIYNKAQGAEDTDTSSFKGFGNINAGTLFIATDNGLDGVVISARPTEELAAEVGLSTTAAATLVGLANASGPLAAVSIAAQNALEAGAVDVIEAEVAKVAPVEKPVLHSVSTTVQNQVLSLVASRMAGGTAGRSGGDFVTTGRGVWAHGLLNRSKMNGAFKGDTRGVAFGADATFNQKYMFGLGYARGDTDVNAGAHKTDIETNTLFAYAQYKPNKWFVNGAFNYTFADYTENTDLFGVNVNSDYDVDSYGLQVMSGYDFASGVTPSVGLRYLAVHQDEYSNGLTRVAATDTDFLTGVAGVKYAFDINATRELRLRPELRAAATYDFMSDEAIATVTLPGAAAYVVNADRLSRAGGEFGIGLSALYRGVTVSLMYDLDLHKDYTSQTGMLKFRYNF